MASHTSFDCPPLRADKIRYVHPNGDELFTEFDLTLPPARYGLVGPNGVGKTTLLEMLASGTGSNHALIGPPNCILLHRQDEIPAKATIADLIASASNLTNVRKLAGLLHSFRLDRLDKGRHFATLSSGERLRLRLACILCRQVQWLLLDEPTAHLDPAGVAVLGDILAARRNAVIVASHDYRILDQMDEIIELSSHGIRHYGRSYSLYLTLKLAEERSAAKFLGSAQAQLILQRRIRRKLNERTQHRVAASKKRAIKHDDSKVERSDGRRKAQNTAARQKAVWDKRNRYTSTRPMTRS